jgi:uncharacterized protein YqeY
MAQDIYDAMQDAEKLRNTMFRLLQLAVQQMDKEEMMAYVDYTEKQEGDSPMNMWQHEQKRGRE